MRVIQFLCVIWLFFCVNNSCRLEKTSQRFRNLILSSSAVSAPLESICSSESALLEKTAVLGAILFNSFKLLIVTKSPCILGLCSCMVLLFDEMMGVPQKMKFLLFTEIYPL